MLIVAANADLHEFCDQMFGQMEAGVAAHGGTLAFTAEQFRSYCITGIKVRVEHVSGRTWRSYGHDYTGMTVREGWAMPTPMMDIISSVGTARLGASEIRVFPVWDKAADGLVMNKAERDFVSQALRSAGRQLGFQTSDALSSDFEGHQQTMVLVYLPTYGEWWSKDPVSREDAAASLLLGLRYVEDVTRGDGGADWAIVDNEQVATALTHMPIWMPELRMERQVVVRYLTEMAKLA
jgi:hypothetical protein